MRLALTRPSDRLMWSGYCDTIRMLGGCLGPECNTYARGERKCEANALVTRPDQGRILCRNAIESYIGPEALGRFDEKRRRVTDEMNRVRIKTGLNESIEKALKLIDEFEEAP